MRHSTIRKDAGDRPYHDKSLGTYGVPLQGMLDAYEQVAYRTTVTAILTP